LGLEPAGETGYRQRFPVTRDTSSAAPSGPNIVALSPGLGPLAAELVMVVAHMDHTGVGRPVGGDSIRNGADDNASGTAGLLAVADAFAGLPREQRRGVVFLAVSGEERGLVGSRWFAAHPTIALDRVVGLVNLDMISRNRPDSVYLNGWGKSSLSALVERLAAQHRELGLAVGPDPEDRAVTPADSDHWPFQRRGIPYIFFYTGQTPDTHNVGDEPSRVDPDKASRVARLAWLTVHAIATGADRPVWNAESRRANVAPGM
jgi:Zn-dependent M28 family amino/carboxypeptidase